MEWRSSRGWEAHEACPGCQQGEQISMLSCQIGNARKEAPAGLSHEPNLVCKFPWLIKPASCVPGVAASFLVPPCSTCGAAAGPPGDAPEEAADQLPSLQCPDTRFSTGQNVQYREFLSSFVVTLDMKGCSRTFLLG